MLPSNPFPTTGYFGPKFFCDREVETDKILEYINGGESCLLLGLRRLGKTALIRHVLEKLPTNRHGIYLDILHTENENDFLNALASGLLQSIPEKSPIGKRVWEFVKSLRPTITFDPLSGIPNVGIDVNDTSRQVKAIFQFLSQQSNHIIIAIDEFQQIDNYPQKNTEAWLRSVIQSLPNVIFIFAGSQQHILGSMFSDPSKPFFRSASPIKIDKIESKVYTSFIKSHFDERKREISEAIIHEILDWTNCHTYYVQLLCNRIFRSGENKISTEVWQLEASKIIKENELFFFNYRSMLSPQQWKLAKAVAKQSQVTEPSSKKFISAHDLGSPATVLRSLEALLKKEILYKEYDNLGKEYYSIYDIFFQRWLENLP